MIPGDRVTWIDPYTGGRRYGILARIGPKKARVMSVPLDNPPMPSEPVHYTGRTLDFPVAALEPHPRPAA